MTDSNFLRKIECLLLCIISAVRSANLPPNIVFIMADDMGWNDVSYHGSDQILTPNLDTLATRSVILQQYYSEAICTPARTALLTGKYPMRLGMQGMPLYNSEDRGIPLTERLLPSHLKELGYSTHLVGKWHVGMSKKEFLPTSRGYDSHFGIRGGFIDYYTYNKVEAWPNGRLLFGLDFFDNDIPQDHEDRYVSDLFTERAIGLIEDHNSSQPLFLHLAYNAPHAGNSGGALQPPLNISVQNQHIAHSDRRLYAEVVANLDESIGKVVQALADKGILEDTIIIFVSDNGSPTVGPFSNWGVNLPFRGKKETPWEGAVRVPAFIWHPSLKPRVWKGLMHITDWLPTLITAAGGSINKEIDGISHWESFVQFEKFKRKDVLIAVEDGEQNVYAAYRAGDYKIVVGNVSGLSNGYYGAEFMAIKSSPPDYFSAIRSSDTAKVFEAMGIGINYDEVMAVRKASVVRQLDKVKDIYPCEPTPMQGCLYNIRKDPSESHNLWQQSTRIANLLTSRLRSLWAMQKKRGPIALDIRADPVNFGYTWLPWLNDTTEVSKCERNISELATPKSGSDILPEFTSSRVNETVDNFRTLAVVIGCENVTGLRNFLCLLRSVL